MLLGQQKCGTSSLWNLLTAHPHIRMAGHRKENFYWGPGGTFHDEMRWDMCLLPTQGYTAFLEADHAFRDVCTGALPASHIPRLSMGPQPCSHTATGCLSSQ